MRFALHSPRAHLPSGEFLVTRICAISPTCTDDTMQLTLIRDSDGIHGRADELKKSLRSPNSQG